MTIRAVAILTAFGVPMALAQLLSALTHPALAFVAAAAIGFGSFAPFKLFELDLLSWWAPPMLAAASSLTGVLLCSLRPSRATWAFGFAPALALATAGIVVLVRRGASKRCALCNRRLGSGVAFECPRCGLLVCDQGCWDFDHCRCRLCEQHKVPVFSPDGRWWDKQLGPRTGHGRCQLCQSEAAEVDLRACAKCGRPQCRSCWDYANGQCSRCGWVIGDLPPQLKPYVLPIREPGGAAGRRSAGTRSAR